MARRADVERPADADVVAEANALVAEHLSGYVSDARLFRVRDAIAIALCRHRAGAGPSGPPPEAP